MMQAPRLAKSTPLPQPEIEERIGMGLEQMVHMRCPRRTGKTLGISLT